MKNEPAKYPVTDDSGRRGEEMAREYLITKGFTILDLNWHHGHKEVDIVARLGNEIVVVEVKTRGENYAEKPYEAVTNAKIKNIVEVADAWLRIHKVDLETRFDVISILLKRDGSFVLEHFEGAFLPPVN